VNSQSSTLNPSQRQRLLITCKHIDRLLGDIEATLDATAAKTVFPNYIADIAPDERRTIEEDVARMRSHLLDVLASQSLAPDEARISASHSVEVNLTFVEIAVAELAPRYMRGYGPVSQEASADLATIAAKLESGVRELRRHLLLQHVSADESATTTQNANASSS
jgi:hypothetical protein